MYRVDVNLNLNLTRYYSYHAIVTDTYLAPLPSLNFTSSIRLTFVYEHILSKYTIEVVRETKAHVRLKPIYRPCVLFHSLATEIVSRVSDRLHNVVCLLPRILMSV